MTYFFRENIAAIAGILVMAAYWFILNYRSVNTNILSIDKNGWRAAWNQ